MIPRRPRPLCALCGDREATTITDWEFSSGRTGAIVACWPCLSPVPDPPEEYEPTDIAARGDLRVAVLAILRRTDGVTVGEVTDALGIGADDLTARNHVASVLSRLVAAEQATAEGKAHGKQVYRWASDHTRAVRDAIATLPAGEFTATEAGLSSALLGKLSAAGLIEVAVPAVKSLGKTARWRRTARRAA